MKKWSLLLCFLALPALADRLDLKQENKSIYIDEIKRWELKRDLFGMPFIYFSPQKNGQRSSISFTDTGAELELNTKDISSTQKKYQEGRRKWADSVDAKVLSYLPYKLSTNRLGHKIHRIGFSYEHQDKTYVEKSFYIECRGRIIFSKALRLTTNVDHDKDFNDLVESIDCGGI